MGEPRRLLLVEDEPLIAFLFATGYAEGGIGWDGPALVIAKPYGRDQVARALGSLLP
jgi:hypothetical protein